jgi:glycosyltransferase involved in cell wall biosynthesis
MNDDPTLSIILPVYNQSDHLSEIVTAYVSVLANLKHLFEIILVVNASSDDSLAVARRLAGDEPTLHVLHDPQPGWGRAVRNGLHAARGEIVAYTNSARTTPYTLSLLVMLALANPGCVLKATRRLRYPLARRAGSVLYNIECRALFGLANWDVNGTPKVFHRDLIPLLNLQQDGDLLDLELLVKCKTLGCQVLEVPVVSSVRHGSNPSTTDLGSACKMYWGALRLWRTTRVRQAAAEDGSDG